MKSLHGEIIHVAVWLRERNSPCAYEDYYNVLRKKFDDKFLTHTDWKRKMRLLKQRGVFMGSEGQFIVNNTLFEHLKNDGEKE